jgi:DNA-directed RNA polymerase specialized sigma24 family protein
MRADSLGQFSTRRRGSRHNVGRDTYLRDAAQYAPRGQDLPQTKLLDMDVIDIRSAKRQREALLKHIRENLSNEALAKRYGVHQRTIEKALSRETHSNLP